VRLPRDVTGVQLAQALRVLGYELTRQKGSHMRLTTHQKGEHHISIPAHDPLRVGLLAGILDDVAGHFQISRDDLLRQLFG
jgi:predicted RNA binding protein YcfA (HicA-like mRNA interferase family)